MATITRGYTFGATEQVTNSKLHSLIDSATISAIAQADLSSGLGLTSRSTSSPSDSDQLWIDTSTTPATLKLNDGTNWIIVGEHNILTNRTGQTTSIGQVCVIDTTNANSFKFTSTEGDINFAGVTIEAIANTTAQDLLTNGITTVLLETSASAGCFLRTSTATGKAVQAASGAAGIFAQVTRAGTASAVARLFGQALHLVQTASAASQAEMEAASSNSVVVTPGNLVWHPRVAKCLGYINGSSGTPSFTSRDNFDASITDNGAGDWTIAVTTDFSSAVWYPFCLASNDTLQSTNEAVTANIAAIAAGTLQLQFGQHDGGVNRDPNIVIVGGFGDQ